MNRHGENGFCVLNILNADAAHLAISRIQPKLFCSLYGSHNANITVNEPQLFIVAGDDDWTVFIKGRIWLQTIVFFQSAFGQLVTFC